VPDQTSVPAACLSGISKTYGAIQALRSVSFEIKPGEIVGLIGANGAGKSSLMKVLAGAVSPDSGTIELWGEEVSFRRPLDAAKHGIALVPQELQIVESQSVASNLFMANLPSRAGFISRRGLRAGSERLLARVGLDRIAPDSSAAELTAVEARLVSIAQALSQSPRILILDEPSAALPSDIADLLGPLLGDLAASGTAVIYVSHRLYEIQALTHRVFAMRDGHWAGDLRGTEMRIPKMVELVGGRALAEEPSTPAPVREGSEVVLSARGLCGNLVRDVDLILHAGEVVGVGGLYGSGRSELLRLLGGNQKMTSGEVKVLGGPAPPSPTAAVARGVIYVPEERRRMIFPSIDVMGNMSMTILGRLSRHGLLRSRKLEREPFAKGAEITRLKGDPDAPILTLSGGNQQKACLARALLVEPRLLLLDEPTLGVDVHSRAEIHRVLLELAGSGVTLLVASADPEELALLCPRVLMLVEGRLTQEIHAPFTADDIITASYNRGAAAVA
jgi:ribose transport system ATP-binding protein